MPRKKISSGVVHEVPADLRKALTADPKALTAWEDITPLARNEWICWIDSAKKAETRSRRIDWGCSSLRDGKRRPVVGPDALTANSRMVQIVAEYRLEPETTWMVGNRPKSDINPALAAGINAVFVPPRRSCWAIRCA